MRDAAALEGNTEGNSSGWLERFLLIQQGRLSPLDFIRTLAITLVVLFHSNSYGTLPRHLPDWADFHITNVGLITEPNEFGSQKKKVGICCGLLVNPWLRRS